jgi:hypothetical protein
MSNHSFVLSIEPMDGPTFIHKFHLGTDLSMAKTIASEIFKGRNRSKLIKDYHGHIMSTRTVAILYNHNIVSVYDGEWDR